MNRRRLAQEFKNSNEGWFFQIGSTNGNPISFFLSKISIIHRISNEKHQYGIDQLDLWQAPAIDTTKSVWWNRRFQLNDFMAKVSRKMCHLRLIQKKTTTSTTTYNSKLISPWNQIKLIERLFTFAFKINSRLKTQSHTISRICMWGLISCVGVLDTTCDLCTCIRVVCSIFPWCLFVNCTI